MAAVAAEADGEPLFGQVVGVGQEPSPLKPHGGPRSDRLICHIRVPCAKKGLIGNSLFK